MLAGNPRKVLQRLRPYREFPGQPPLLRLAVPNESPKISVPRHHLNTHPAKELLRPGYIPRVHDQNNFVRLQVVSPWRAPRLKILKMHLYVLKVSFSPRIIRVPRMCDTGVGSPKLPQEGEDPYAIGYHGKGVPLVHNLLAVQ